MRRRKLNRSVARPVWIRDERPVSFDEVAWLRSAEGEVVCQEMAAGRPADTPATIAHWRQRLEPEHVAAAWNQVCLRRQGQAKFSLASKMIFDRIGLEQATGEVVAMHKARRFAGRSRVADLCCGIGGDALALGAVASVVAVDWSEARVAMTEHNASVYGHSVVGRVADVAFDRPEADAVHVDPDRRPAGRRGHRIEASLPGPTELARIVEHYRHVAIKLSAGADLDHLPFEGEIEVISHHGECKQAVVWTGDFCRCLRRATLLPTGESVAADAGDELAWPVPVAIEPDMYLFEPDSAVIRANLVGMVARACDLNPIDPQIAYLAGGTTVSSGLLSAFRIIEVTEWSLKSVRRLLTAHDIGSVEIKTRGFAGRPEEILHKLRLTGKCAAVLFLTRLGHRPTAILAERLTGDYSFG